MIPRVKLCDRRRFQRLKVYLTVFYKVEEPEYARRYYGDSEREASTLDLGQGGMALLTKTGIPCGTKLFLRFLIFYYSKEASVKFQHPIEICGEVRSCLREENNSYRIGICFDEISAEYKTNIDNFIKTVARQ